MADLELLLVRGPSTDDGIIGNLYAPDGKWICYIGELPWRDNQNDISCIPAGRYRCTYLVATASGKHKDVYHLENVPHRGGVLQHIGNYTGRTDLGKRSDSHGCQLPGLAVGRSNGQRVVLASHGGLDAIHRVTGRKSYWLTIR